MRTDSPQAHRLLALEDTVAYSLAEDQALLVEGIIIGYELLTCAGTLMSLEQRRQLNVDSSALQLAVDMRSNTNNNNTRNYNGGGRAGCDESSMLLNALRLLNEVNTAIAWCEGKIAVVGGSRKHKCTSTTTASASSLLSLNKCEDGAKKVLRENPLKAHLHTCEVRGKYYEVPDGSIRSHSRSSAWPSEAPPQLSSSLPSADRKSPEECCSCSCCVTINPCNLDFNKCAAGQISLQAQLEKRRLWLLRCVAEEAVRRHGLTVEERLGRVTLLITAREELAAGIDAEIRIRSEGTFLASAASCIKEWRSRHEEEEYEEEYQKPLRETNNKFMYVSRNVAGDNKKEEKMIKFTSSCARNNVRSPLVAETSVTNNTALLSFAYTLLLGAEESRRLHIDKEAELSWRLLLSQFQTVLNYINSRRLISAKETLHNNLIAEFNVCTSTSPNAVLCGNNNNNMNPSWLVGSKELSTSESYLRSGSRTHSCVHSTWTVERVCSHSASPHAMYTPPVRKPARPHQIRINSSPRQESLRSKPGQSTRDVSAKGPSGANAFIPPVQSPLTDIPQSQQQGTRTRRISTANDIAFHICMSVELVERKQVTMLEQRAWEELMLRLHSVV